MQHPFMPDISGKSLDELQASIQDLTGKLNYAYRVNNPNLIAQLQMVIEGYKAESNKRLDEIYKKQNMDNRINISKEKQ